MKHFLLTLGFLATICCYTFAQVVTISGSVTDANGAALSNYPVLVESDSSSAVWFSQTVYTNNSGTYSVSPNVGSATQGLFDVTVQDSCTGYYNIQTVSFSPSAMTFNNVNFTICTVTPPSCQAGLSYQQTSTGYAFTGTATGGTAPYSYSWDFGDGVTSTLQNPTHNYSASGTYYPCLTITDATGCTSTYCDNSGINITIMTSGSLHVSVITDSTSATLPQAVVYLIQHDSAAGTLTAIQTDTTTTGYATFGNVPFGDYLVKAALLPTDPDYSSYLPTYYQQSLTWSGATSVNLNPSAVGYAMIELIQGNNVGGGPGFIGGLISQGANRGPGDPVVGALVILYDANMNPIGYTYTDDDGEYNFDNLPYGVYYVYVEELGIPATPIEVTLSATTPTMDQVHFDINSTRVTFTSTNDLQAVTNSNIFPNPVTDVLYLEMDLDQMIDAEISIINMTGQVIQQRQTTLTAGNHRINFDTQTLPAGIYTLQLRSNLGVTTHKFMK